MNHTPHFRLADWQNDHALLTAIREEVFVMEQNVPLALEWDEHDASAQHFLAFIDQQAVATARLKSDGQIGRMAVRRPYRGQGIGDALLRFVLDTARATHDEVYLHAQVQVKAFYQRHGFIEQGEVFKDAGIDHIHMVRRL